LIFLIACVPGSGAAALLFRSLRPGFVDANFAVAFWGLPAESILASFAAISGPKFRTAVYDMPGLHPFGLPMFPGLLPGVEVADRGLGVGVPLGAARVVGTGAGVTVFGVAGFFRRPCAVVVNFLLSCGSSSESASSSTACSSS